VPDTFQSQLSVFLAFIDLSQKLGPALPNAPAFDTADARSAVPARIIPPQMIGTSTPSKFVSLILN